MIKRLLYIVSILLLAVGACDKEENPEYTPNPAIELSFKGFQSDGVILEIKSLNTDGIYVLVQPMADEAPAAEAIRTKGVKADGKEVFIGGLQSDSDYTAYAIGLLKDKYSKVSECTFTTPYKPTDRTEIPTFADLDLLSGGITNKTPNTWDENRLKPHVTFTDENGQEQWLHEAFLLIGGEDAKRNRILCIDSGGQKSGNQDSWTDFADYWLNDGGVVDVLDQTIANAKGRIGRPSFRHKVVITMPDPIMLETFTDKNSSTTYWGKVNDRKLDFANTADQLLAYQWYINYVIEKWEQLAPQNVDLAGFYILSEALVAKPSGWNYKYKRWDKILPPVSSYLHEMKYGLYWIPYYQADGYDMTSQLGIDYTWLQPNKYWDYPEKKEKKSWTWVFGAMGTYGHGMEIEFEGSHGEAGWSQYESGVPRTSSSILETVRTSNDAQGTPKGSPNPQAARNKQLLRDYMNEFKKAGYYGKARIATYSGTNAMYELATSPDALDRAMYLEYCYFIVENPLRK